MATKYEVNKLGCFLKWVAPNEVMNKTKKNLVLSIIDNYYFQIKLKDLPKIFADTFLGRNLTPTEETALYNCFIRPDTIYNVQVNNIDGDAAIFVGRMYPQNNNLPNIENNTLLFDIDFKTPLLYYPPAQQNTCVYIKLIVNVDETTASILGLPSSQFAVVLLHSDVFDWVSFPTQLLLNQYFENNKYLSIIEYNAPNNAFDLVYEKVGFGQLNNTNKIRVPCYLDFPQFKNKEENYRNSLGFYVKINSTSEKEWKLTTEYLSQEEHETLSIAFLHPNLKINGKSFFQSAGYEIKYSEEIGSIPEAKAETKFIQSPYNTQNPNFRF